MLPLRHIHNKRRPHKSRTYSYTLLDHLIYLIAFAGPLMTIPQIYDIWINRQLSVNAITWAGYLVIGFIWLFYGIVHKEKAIIFSNLLGSITTGLVVLGVFLYK